MGIEVVLAHMRGIPRARRHPASGRQGGIDSRCRVGVVGGMQRGGHQPAHHIAQGERLEGHRRFQRKAAMRSARPVALSLLHHGFEYVGRGLEPEGVVGGA